MSNSRPGPLLNFTEGQLEELFSEAGTIESARVISEHHSRQSKGFAFMEMILGEETKEAIANSTVFSSKTEKYWKMKLSPPNKYRLLEDQSVIKRTGFIALSFHKMREEICANKGYG